MAKTPSYSGKADSSFGNYRVTWKAREVNPKEMRLASTSRSRSRSPEKLRVLPSDDSPSTKEFNATSSTVSSATHSTSATGSSARFSGSVSSMSPESSLPPSKRAFSDATPTSNELMNLKYAVPPSDADLGKYSVGWDSNELAGCKVKDVVAPKIKSPVENKGFSKKNSHDQ